MWCAAPSTLLTTHGTTAAGRACHIRGPSSGTAGQHTGGTACHTSLAGQHVSRARRGAHGRDGRVEGTGRRGVYPESPHTGECQAAVTRCGHPVEGLGEASERPRSETVTGQLRPPQSSGPDVRSDAWCLGTWARTGRKPKGQAAAPGRGHSPDSRPSKCPTMTDSATGRHSLRPGKPTPPPGTGPSSTSPDTWTRCPAARPWPALGVGGFPMWSCKTISAPLGAVTSGPERDLFPTRTADRPSLPAGVASVMKPTGIVWPPIQLKVVNDRITFTWVF